MRILVLDTECIALDFVLRCVDADHDVRWWRLMKPNKARKDGEGFKGFRFVEDWRDSMPWAREGLILCTGNAKLMPQLDRFRDMGYRIFAPTEASANLEINRAKGMAAMEKAGIPVPPYKMFGSVAEAEAFARKSDKAWVFKTMGDNEDKSLSYVASDPADLVGWLQHQKKTGEPIKGKVMLQEKIDMVAELGASGWFGPDGFLDPTTIYFEHKKLMNDDIGPNTGEQGTIIQYVDGDKLFKDTLDPMTKAFKAAGHIGDTAVGCGIDAKGKAWPFEFTMRFGFPSWYIQASAHKGDPAQWMRDLLDGKDSLKVSYDAQIGVVMRQPAHFHSDDPGPEVEGYPIHGVDKSGLRPDVHLVSAMLGTGPVMQDGKLVDGRVVQTSGSYVAIATALGKSVEAARKKVYRTLEDVTFSNAMYRTDIGAKVIETLPELHKLGYATELD